MPPRKSAFARLQDVFHTHPRGRLYEIAFWGGLGVLFLVVAVVGYFQGWLFTPFAWIVGIIGACMVGFAVLPRHRSKRGPAPLPPGKRGQLAKQKRAAKAERPKRGPGPPLE